MRVLLTGSTGLVGAACATWLAERDFEVVGVARSPGGGSSPIGSLAIDLREEDADERIAAATAPCEAIIHAAAQIDERDRSSLVLANCLGTERVLRVAERWGAGRFVYMSSVPVIGRPLKLPISEDHPVAPATVYHASKLFGEHLVAGAKCGLSLRIGSPVGPGMPARRILPTFVRRALAGEPLVVIGRGSRRQSYVATRDLAAAVELALTAETCGVINIAGAVAISNRELAELCVEALGSSSEIVFEGEDAEEGDDWDVSIERAAAELGWRPRISLADSVRALAAAAAGGTSNATAANGAHPPPRSG